MKLSPGARPRLPSHYYVLYEPPDSSGDEALIFVSERRKIKVKGTLFREFLRYVIPLLDGCHTVAEIEAAATDLFPAREVAAALHLLAEQHLLADDCDSVSADRRAPEPQLNFFHEVSENAAGIEQRLARATVSIVGLAGAGSLVAVNLAAAGVRHLRLLDSGVVVESDAYFDPIYRDSNRGRPRAHVVREGILGRSPLADVTVDEQAFENEEHLAASITGSDLVVCCADRGQAAVFYKLNRACMSTKTSWISSAASGFEVVIGPMVRPEETPCYLCYTMRSVSCAETPEDEFGLQRFLDHRKSDDSGKRENLVFSVGLAANLLGLEALKLLTGYAPCASLGAVLVADLFDMTTKKHVVLRHPRCPICFGEPASTEKQQAKEHASDESTRPPSREAAATMV